MLIRPKNSFLLLVLCVFNLFVGAMDARQRDTFMEPFYLGLAAVSILAWSTTYTTLSEGVLTKRIFLVPYRSFLVDEIESVQQPHKNSGKWVYGAVIVVCSKSGKKLTLQPNKPEAFLALLRKEAPQAAYLL